MTFSSHEFKDHLGARITRPKEAPIVWRPSVYGIAARKVGSRTDILFIDNNYCRRLTFPGGGVEVAESMVDALKREVVEESGYGVELSSADPMLIIENSFFLRFDGTYNHAILMFFHVYVVSLPADDHVLDPESAGVEWVPLSKVDCSNVAIMCKEPIKRLLQRGIPRYSTIW